MLQLLDATILIEILILHMHDTAIYTVAKYIGYMSVSSLVPQAKSALIATTSRVMNPDACKMLLDPQTSL